MQMPREATLAGYIEPRQSKTNISVPHYQKTLSG